jgi:pimeloyl-ACP methyl ester carboxylesterase
MLPACGDSAMRVEDARTERDADVWDAPDRTSDRAVEVFEAGAGDATVVFESGLGDDWTPWQQVAAEVSESARVFAYSRPGYGRSEPSEDPRAAADIVEALRTLLAARGYAPPYVLVGHSFGGAYMELFAKAHPEQVGGLVLVDPRHRDFTAACAEAGLDGCSIPADLLASLPPVQLAEYAAFASTSDEIHAAGGFGAYPVRVLTATSHGFAPQVEALWVSMLRSLADEAADGEQKVLDGAGHYLQVQHPHEVANAIISLVSSARLRSTKPLP